MFPKLFELGPLTIHSYGLLLATAFLVATALVARLAEKDGIARSRAWDLGFVILISGLLGAKLLMIITNAGYYLSSPSQLLSLDFWRSGGVFYGGLLGALLGSYLYLRRDRSISFWKMADAAAPAIALGQAVGRLGCFAAGCDYGTQSNAPWAVTFTSEYAHQYVGVPVNIALHPVQLYESASAFLLCGFLVWLHGQRSFPGQIFCAYVSVYAVLRFFLEFFRGDVDRGFVFGGLLSTSQLISMLLLVVALIAYSIIRKRKSA
jgi:phosphatidylglycerol:prolipoprotein diacylglycerol transferase